ncbi:MAG TPA: PQQ-dependent dehydrogenase, methanol/ethanol family [Bryobacteraceae bacterium]|jgi:alcohol dehydrogenase (cytochrome c)
MHKHFALGFALLGCSLNAQVTYDRILHADREPQNWLTYSGGYASNRYSLLNQVNRQNVGKLQLKWVYHPEHSKMENTPLIVDGVLYAGTMQEIVALDAVTGRQYWKLSRPFNRADYPGQHVYEVNKGLAIGGDKVFWATATDCHLLAIDAKTGRVIWDKVLADWKQGYQFNVAPLVVKNMVILGPATNEMGANCWVAAYDIDTGKEIWRFYTSPNSADDPAAKTWAGDSWKHGGSPIWNGGTYDPATNLTFWGTGNPNPGWNGGPRAPGDNLYSDSVVALDADTGKLKWYYQFTPGDEYDWDSTQVPVLADINWKGAPRKVMLWGNRNGFFYVLDRATGEFLLGKPFIKQTWAVGIDEKGRPIKAPGFWPKPMGGIEVMPGSQGGTNWYPPSYSPRTGLFYMSVWDNYLALSQKEEVGPWVQGELYNGSRWWAGYGQSGPPPGRPAATPARRAARRPAAPNFKTEDEGYGAIRAIDPKTGEKKWDFKMVNNTESGVLSTAGDLVFGGGMDGDFVALDAETGKLLWSVYLGGANASGPVSYAVNGKQYIIGTGEGTMFAFALPD